LNVLRCAVRGVEGVFSSPEVRALLTALDSIRQTAAANGSLSDFGSELCSLVQHLLARQKLPKVRFGSLTSRMGIGRDGVADQELHWTQLAYTNTEMLDLRRSFVL
jgi:hypothetical protein